MTKSRPPTALTSQNIWRASGWEQKFISSANLGEASVKKTNGKKYRKEKNNSVAISARLCQQGDVYVPGTTIVHWGRGPSGANGGSELSGPLST